MNKDQYFDEHFRQFADSLERAIAVVKAEDQRPMLVRQEQCVNELVQLEKDFKLALISHSAGVDVYKQFIAFICDKQRNILGARPYFRERQGVFTKRISDALRRRSERALFRFHFNYRFVKFVLDCREWAPRSRIRLLAKKIVDLRQELVTMNMPLAISRAKIFFSRTQRSHLSYMDLIQIACEGLISGIDKFVPPYGRAFRGVAIGRMTGNFIEAYSETLIHFYPEEKRKLYRGNKSASRQVGPIDYAQVAREVNRGAKKGVHKTTPAEIADIMAASSTVSTDVLPNGDDEDAVQTADRFAAPVSAQPDYQSERREAVGLLFDQLDSLDPFDRKVLRLFGISGKNLGIMGGRLPVPEPQRPVATG